MKNNDIIFGNIEELVDYLVCEVDDNEDKFIEVVARFDEAKEFIKNIMAYDGVNFDILQLESPMMDNYEDEFILSLWVNDGSLEFGCEKIKDEDGDYISPGGDVVLLFDNCSSKIITLCGDSELYFVSIDDEYDCDKEYNECWCDDCDCCGCDDDDIYDIYNILIKFGF